MKTVLTFLDQLKDNNDRDWFNANKAAYESARQRFEELVVSLVEGIIHFDGAIVGTDPKKSIFRIYRDIRFSKDKSPYKTGFGASISPGGRKSGIAGYYVHIEPGGVFLAGGQFKPDSATLSGIRNAIVKKTDDFLQISQDTEFKKYFEDINTHEFLKKTPAGLPKNHPADKYLKYKDYVVSHQIKDADLVKRDFADRALDVYRAMFLFITFLREA